MERFEDSSFENSDFGWLVALSLMFFALVALALWREFRPDWRPVQKRFRTVLQQYGHVEEAGKFKPGVKQIWIPKINVTDRCITCHLGYQWSSRLPATLPEPLTPHPPLPYMDKHPFQQFGCTPCHGGQGWATSERSAHGPVAGWEDPLLSSGLARRYGLTEGELMQMRCNFCHRRDVETPGMDQINLAKRLVKKKKCVVCHAIEGHGGTQAAELTFYGDTNPELVDFSHVTGEHTLFNWDYQHFMTPDRISPHTSMPTFNFTPAEARALVLLVLSWKREVFPPEYIPPPLEAAPAPASAPPGS